MKRLSIRRIISGILSLAFVFYAAWIAPSACSFIQYVWNPHGVKGSILDVDQGFKFPAVFPPDPGRAGKQDIDGIDSDRDGVRDDVQRWIYALVPNELKKQMALKQYARYYRLALDPEFGPGVRKEANRISNRAIRCIIQNFPDQLSGHYESVHLNAKMLNTYARTRRFLENESKWTYSEVTASKKEEPQPCDER